MTFAIGGADYESYQRAYDKLIKSDYNQIFRFSKLGLLYYDDDDITPGTYFAIRFVMYNTTEGSDVLYCSKSDLKR